MSTATLYEFRADVKRRELAGLVVPWNVVGENEAGKWVFERGSLSWADDITRVKLVRHHDPDRPVGHAIELNDRRDGLHGRFRIARGQTGDEVLNLAADGALDGFSAGPRIGRNGFTVDRNGLRTVHRAELVEVSVVAFPAFPDARVASAVFDRGDGIVPVYFRQPEPEAVDVRWGGAEAGLGGGGFALGVRYPKGPYDHG